MTPHVPMDLTEAKFLKDVAGHVMTIERDDGLFRHIKFARPDTFCMGFRLTTWPGYLAYTGDMGCYVFTRLPDMFEFFRTDRLYAEKHRSQRTLHINLGYWSEKVVAQDRDGVMEFSPDRFRETVKEWLNNAEAPMDVLRAAVEVYEAADDGEFRAMEAAIGFEHNGRLWLQDFWEANVKEYTHRFVWCCYALAWGIQQYDNAKVPA